MRCGRPPDRETSRVPDLQDPGGEAVSEGRHATYTHACIHDREMSAVPTAGTARVTWSTASRADGSRLCAAEHPVLCQTSLRAPAVAVQTTGGTAIPGSSGDPTHASGPPDVARPATVQRRSLHCGHAGCR